VADAGQPVVVTTERLLDLLEEMTSAFFVLGWVAGAIRG
jgi:hypothetical protein